MLHSIPRGGRVSTAVVINAPPSPLQSLHPLQKLLNPSVSTTEKRTSESKIDRYSKVQEWISERSCAHAESDAKNHTRQNQKLGSALLSLIPSRFLSCTSRRNSGSVKSSTSFRWSTGKLGSCAWGKHSTRVGRASPPSEHRLNFLVTPNNARIAPYA